MNYLQLKQIWQILLPSPTLLEFHNYEFVTEGLKQGLMRMSSVVLKPCGRSSENEWRTKQQDSVALFSLLPKANWYKEDELGWSYQATGNEIHEQQKHGRISSLLPVDHF